MIESELLELKRDLLREIINLEDKLKKENNDYLKSKITFEMIVHREEIDEIENRLGELRLNRIYWMKTLSKNYINI